MKSGVAGSSNLFMRDPNSFLPLFASLLECHASQKFNRRKKFPFSPPPLIRLGRSFFDTKQRTCSAVCASLFHRPNPRHTIHSETICCGNGDTTEKIAQKALLDCSFHSFRNVMHSIVSKRRGMHNIMALHQSE